MYRLQHKAALIVGGDPITLGIATRFAQEGASVTVVDEAPALQPFEAAGLRTAALAEGPVQEEAMNAAVRRAVDDRSLHILVLGGGDIPLEAEWCDLADLDPGELVARNARDLRRALCAVRAAGPFLQKNGGSIIFLFSPAGFYSEGGWAGRTITHHAKHGLARELAAEWGQHQVRVNTLVPLARTPGFEAYRRRNPELVDWRVSKLAMQRVGDTVQDIGGAAVFLASDDTRFVTGSMVFADGGAFLSTPVVETCAASVASTNL